jgi:hypothetical protein
VTVVGFADERLDLLPRSLAALSGLATEIALPYPVVLQAVDALEAQNVLLLGWEGLAIRLDGAIGGYPGEAFGGLSVEPPETSTEWAAAVSSSAARHRQTIEHEARTREWFPPIDGVELIFCLTVARSPPPSDETGRVARRAHQQARTRDQCRLMTLDLRGTTHAVTWVERIREALLATPVSHLVSASRATHAESPRPPPERARTSVASSSLGSHQSDRGLGVRKGRVELESPAHRLPPSNCGPRHGWL